MNMPIADISKRAILAPANKNTLEINKEIIRKLSGQSKVYSSADSIVFEDTNDFNNYTPKFLHESTPSGMPPRNLELKSGVIKILLRNPNPKKGMCNGTRSIVESVHDNFILAEIVSECNKGYKVMIPRIKLQPRDANLPFILSHRQFPIIPAYAMTINKAQGQSFEHAGIFLNEAVFAHGQL